FLRAVSCDLVDRVSAPNRGRSTKSHQETRKIDGDQMRSFVMHSHRKLSVLALALPLFYSLNAIAQAPTEPAQNTYIEGAALWQQSSGERRALSYQAFALARMMLDRDLRTNRRLTKPRAVIVDLDETILDNSL